MELKQLRNLALKIFETLNNMNPEYMKEIFIRQGSLHIDLLIQRLTQTIRLNMEIKV